MKKMFVLVIIIVLAISLSACVDSPKLPPGSFGSFLASIGNFGFELNYSEIEKINYTDVKARLEGVGYLVGTHIVNSLPSWVPDRTISADSYLISVKLNDTNFTHKGIVRSAISVGKDSTNKTGAWTSIFFFPSEKYYYNQTNITKDIAYLRLTAKEVFQVCNITADVDKWDLKVNYMD
ncbi:MAG: hypothetical protein WC974_08110 [Thermoplasmata archaeon]